jgi:hypothetical protein
MDSSKETKADNSNANCVFLPSVQERVNQLFIRLPTSHPLAEAVFELREALIQEEEDFQEEEEHLTGGGARSQLSLLRRLVRPFKLHAHILKEILLSDPAGKSTQFRTSLDRYIGDVLCVTYLLQPNEINVAEGSLTLESLFQEIKCNWPRGLTPCYRTWILMHSSLLRTKRFSRAQRQRIGIPELPAQETMVLPKDCYRYDSFMSSEMTLVSDDFGPLGARFRGRDVVRLRDISAHCLLAFYSSIEDGEASRAASEWLCLVHEEVRKVRPITVRPPMVRLFK